MLPCNVKPSSPLGMQMTAAAAILDQYNNGLLTPDCTPLASTGDATRITASGVL
jgi:hypothetical protein